MSVANELRAEEFILVASALSGILVRARIPTADNGSV